MGFSSNAPHSEEGKYSLTALPLLHQRGCQWLFSPMQCCLGAETALTVTFSVSSTTKFVLGEGGFAPMAYWTLPPGKLGLHSLSCIHRFLLKSTPSRFSQQWLRTLAVGLQLLLVSQPILRFVCLLPDAQVAKTSSRPLGIWRWILPLP